MMFRLIKIIIMKLLTKYAKFPYKLSVIYSSDRLDRQILLTIKLTLLLIIRLFRGSNYGCKVS